ncbi:MAG: ATP-binding protein [Acidimicrobiia bacterium]|nr:ATP-binding protein [Acidimicrobiia bacterium]
MSRTNDTIGRRGPLDYAVVGKTHTTFRWASLCIVAISAVVLAVTWRWGEGWVVAILAGGLAGDTYRRRSRASNPQLIIPLDATVMAAAVIITNVPIFTIAAPYVTLIIAAALFLPGQRALVTILYTTAVNGVAALLAGHLLLRTWQPEQALTMAIIITGAFLMLTVAVLIAAGSAVASRDALDTAIRGSELRFRTLASSAPVGVFLLDSDGTCTYANHRMEQLLGRSPVGLPFPDLASPDDVDLLSTLWTAVTGSQDRADVRHRVLDGRGRIRWVITRLARGESDATDSDVFVGTAADVTDATLAEHARNQFAAILETTTDLVGIIDTALNFTYLNNAARAAMGIPLDAPIDTIDPAQTFASVSRPIFAGEVLPALRDAGKWTGELTLIGPHESEVPVSFVFLAHTGPTGRVEYYSGLARDISHIRESERRLEELVRSKDEFVASVSHELRTPLTAVVGLATELRDSRPMFTEDEIGEFVGLIAEQSSEVAHIVEDLLVAARADIGTITINAQVVDLREEVDHIVSTWQSKEDLRVKGSNQSSFAFADAGRTRQIVRNLLTNATRYGGDRIEIRVANGGTNATLQVRDNGPGVPPAKEDGIFDPYSTAHEHHGQPASVGLGLTVSRQLARLMGGDLIYRRDGSWSVFELTLPTPP